MDSDWDGLPVQEPWVETPNPPPSWHTAASCYGMSEADEIFFGSKDTTVRPAMNIAQVKKAKSICQECPVISECLKYALTNNENYGVWGGTTGRTRAKIKAGLEAGDFLIANVLEDYRRWNIRHYETYTASKKLVECDDEYGD